MKIGKQVVKTIEDKYSGYEIVFYKIKQLNFIFVIGNGPIQMKSNQIKGIAHKAKYFRVLGNLMHQFRLQ